MAKKTKKDGSDSKSQIDKTVASDLRLKMEAANEKLKKLIDPRTLPVMDDGAEGAQELSIPLYSTGILSVDDALSGGLPVGRMTELYGEEGSGKSLISLVTIGEMQRNGARCLLFDAESAYEPAWAAKLGVDTSKLMVSDSNIAEDVFKIIETYAESGVIDLVVVDSIANLTTLDVMNSELGAAKYASLPGVLSRMLPRISKVLKRNKVQLILINQVRDVIGAYVKMLSTPGGRNLKHLYHTRIKCIKVGSSRLLKEGDAVTGVEVEAQITKHRGGANYTKAAFRIEYATGLDKIYDVVNFLLANNHITRAGAFYTYGDQKYQGLENLMDAFRNDPAAYEAAVKFAKETIATKKQSQPQVAMDVNDTDAPEADEVEAPEGEEGI